MTLTEFLLARIAEDEESAAALLVDSTKANEAVREPRLLGHEMPGWYLWPRVVAMVSRRVAECEAKRRIVQMHGPYYNDPADFTPPRSEVTCAWCEEDAYPCPTVRLLALPYADHPDYQQEWKP